MNINNPKDTSDSANDKMNDLISKIFKVAGSVLATPPIPDATEKKSQNKHKEQDDLCF